MNLKQLSLFFVIFVFKWASGGSIISQIDAGLNLGSIQTEQKLSNSTSSNSSSGGISLATSNPGLLLTTADTIAFVYPKEMNYEHDYLNVIFKLNDTSRYRIEDSVYDNKSLSVYFILSALALPSTNETTKSSNGNTGGSHLIRLKQHRRRQPTHFAQQNVIHI